MDYDIIIVGSGPAGMSTALHLAKFSPDLSKKILVIESSHHPRPKLCAGGILPDGEYILERLGLNLSKVSRINVKEAMFLFKGKGILMNPYPKSFSVIKREEFDWWLVKEGRSREITILEDTKVLEVITSDEGVTVITDKGEYLSKVVVGADGSNSIVRREALGKDNSSLSIALELFIPDEKSGEINEKETINASFDFSLISEGLQGYVWDFPSQDDKVYGRTRGIYDSRLFNKDKLNLKNTIDSYLSKEGISIKDIKLKGHPIRYFNPKGEFSSSRIILVGDAAGADPIFGEGISFALGYGELAAKEIIKAFHENNFSFINYKKRILKHPMGRTLKRRLKVAKIIYRFPNKNFQKLLWWYLSPAIKWYINHFLIYWAKDIKDIAPRC